MGETVMGKARRLHLKRAAAPKGRERMGREEGACREGVCREGRCREGRCREDRCKVSRCKTSRVEGCREEECKASRVLRWGYRGATWRVGQGLTALRIHAAGATFERTGKLIMMAASVVPALLWQAVLKCAGIAGSRLTWSPWTCLRYWDDCAFTPIRAPT